MKTDHKYSYREENNLFPLPTMDSTSEKNSKSLLNLCTEKHWHRLHTEVWQSLSRRSISN